MPLWKLESDEILIKVAVLSSRDGDNVKHTALKSSAKLFQNGSHFLSFWRSRRYFCFIGICWGSEKKKYVPCQINI
jgi:hypothetical protein